MGWEVHEYYTVLTWYIHIGIYGTPEDWLTDWMIVHDVRKQPRAHDRGLWWRLWNNFNCIGFFMCTQSYANSFTFQSCKNAALALSSRMSQPHAVTMAGAMPEYQRHNHKWQQWCFVFDAAFNQLILQWTTNFYSAADVTILTATYNAYAHILAAFFLWWEYLCNKISRRCRRCP